MPIATALQTIAPRSALVARPRKLPIPGFGSLPETGMEERGRLVMLRLGIGDDVAGTVVATRLGTGAAIGVRRLSASICATIWWFCKGIGLLLAPGSPPGEGTI